jgi:translation initiation factor eIF-2B subunit beta
MLVFLIDAVTANGGIIACTGSQIVASAAYHHSTPVVVCASLHALTPSYIDQDTYLLSVSPEPVLPLRDSKTFLPS